MLVRCIVVHYEMELKIARGLVFYRFQKGQKLLMPVSFLALANNLASRRAI